MSKKVDIDKLIENKFNSGDVSTSLTLESLLAEINATLEQIAGGGAEVAYGSKLPGDLGESEYVNTAQDNAFLTSAGNRNEINRNPDTGGGSDRGIGLQQNSRVNTQELPEIKKTQPKASNVPPKVYKMELQFFYPLLTKDTLGLTSEGEYDSSVFPDFRKACENLGIFKQEKLKNKFALFNTFLSTNQNKSLSQSLSSLMLMKSFYNVFSTLGREAAGLANEDIITSLYGPAAVSVGAGKSADKYVSGANPFDIKVGDRYISLKTRAADAEFTSSFINVFAHIFLYDKKELEIFWFRKSSAGFEPKFKFLYANINANNIHNLIPGGTDTEEERKFLIKETAKLATDISNIEQAYMRALESLINNYSSSTEPEKKNKVDVIKKLIFGKKDKSKISLNHVITHCSQPAREESFDFDFDVEKLILSANENIKNIYNNIKILHNSIEEFVQEFNKFTIPDSQSVQAATSLDPAQGAVALNKANDIPKYAEQTIRGVLDS